MLNCACPADKHPGDHSGGLLQGAGLVQWLECSASTNVSRVRFPDPSSYVGWVCCWFSTLLREVFSGYPQYFQIPIRSRNARPRLNEFFELLGAPWVNKLHLHLHFFYHCSFMVYYHLFAVLLYFGTELFSGSPQFVEKFWTWQFNSKYWLLNDYSLLKRQTKCIHIWIKIWMKSHFIQHQVIT